MTDETLNKVEQSIEKIEYYTDTLELLQTGDTVYSWQDKLDNEAVDHEKGN